MEDINTVFVTVTIRAGEKEESFSFLMEADSVESARMELEEVLLDE